MATLTQPENTGTLDREAVQAAARESSAPRQVDPEELARHAAELRAWLEQHDRPPTEASEPGRPAILVHQPLWMPTPPRYEPPAGERLGTLVDRALAPVRATAADATTGPGFVALPARSRPPARTARSRTLGWTAVIGLWAAAAALLVPLALWAVVGSFDLTVDLSGDDAVGTEQVAGDEAPVEAPAETAAVEAPTPG